MKQCSWSESAGENRAVKQQKRPRRSNKPAMERRRRERINGCLEQLKNFVLIAEGKDPARYTKVEKADILEMTVRFMTAKPSSTSSSNRNGTSTGSPSHYKTGYNACIEDLQQLLNTGEATLPNDAKERLLQHLQTTAADQKLGPAGMRQHAMARDARGNIHSSTENNSITIQSNYNGGSHRAKLAVNCVSPSQNLTVYIPPSNTWSPPVANPPGLDNFCSPPSSPESIRTTSPSGSPTSTLTCTVLQPHNPNTGKLCHNYSTNYQVITDPSKIQIQQSNINNDNSNKQEQIYENKQQIFQHNNISDNNANISYESKPLIQPQSQVYQSFETSHTSYQSLSPPPPAAYFQSSESVLYTEPQSAPLNLAAPKPNNVKEEEEIVATQPRYYQVILPKDDPSGYGAPPMAHNPHGIISDSHWRPWFN